MDADLKSFSILDELVQNFDARLFKTLSEPVRLEILRFLMENGRTDIGTIADHMPQDRSVVSRHLNLMQEAGILRSRKETRHVYYEIDGGAFISKLEAITQQIRDCIATCCPSCCE
jgi:ArsR family transcriptional regulator, nickel/cobalt-responsive transcriptional repressor